LQIASPAPLALLALQRAEARVLVEVEPAMLGQVEQEETMSLDQMEVESQLLLLIARA